MSTAKYKQRTADQDQNETMQLMINNKVTVSSLQNQQTCCFQVCKTTNLQIVTMSCVTSEVLMHVLSW